MSQSVRGAKHNEINLLGSSASVEASNDWQQWPDFPLTGIEFDSRKIVKGNLFVPLQGENDGHRFIESAMANGCQAAFGDRI